MLHEIAIAPSVFYPESYEHPGICDAHMQGIREPLLEYLLIRDLRAGEWSAGLRSRFESMSNPARELIKKCIKRGRFRLAPAALAVNPSDPRGWCIESLASHRQEPLAGILACRAVKALHATEPLVASIESRSAAPWWQQCVISSHPDGPRVPRNMTAYLARLSSILRQANHIIFADPHIDPTRPRYRQFLDLLQATARSNAPHPTVEIHRVRYEGSGANKMVVDRNEWERRFCTSLHTPLSNAGVVVEVFIWNEEHDRHLISNLLGLHLGNGFDTTNDPGAESTWTRLSSLDRDKVQRDYDPQVNSRRLFHRFNVGALRAPNRL